MFHNLFSRLSHDSPKCRKYPYIHVGIPCGVKGYNGITGTIEDFSSAINLFCSMPSEQVTNFALGQKVEIEFLSTEEKGPTRAMPKRISGTVSLIRTANNEGDERKQGIVLNIRDYEVLLPLIQSVCNYKDLLDDFTRNFDYLLYIHTLDGDMHFVSDAVEKMLGFEKESVHEKSLYDVLASPSSEDVQNEMNRIKAGQDPLYEGKPIPILANTREGEPALLEAVFKRGTTAANSTLIFGIARKKSVSLHNVGFALSKAGYVWYCTNKDGVTTIASKLDEKMFGVETVNRSRSELYRFPEDREVFIRLVEKAGFVKDAKVLMKRTNGQTEYPFVVETTSYFPMHSPNYGIHGIQRDITPTLNNFPDGIVIVRGGRVVFCNKKFGTLLEMPDMGLLNRDFAELFHPVHAQAIRAALDRDGKQSMTLKNIEAISVKNDLGRLHRVDLEFEPFPVAKVKSWYVTCKDVTTEMYADLVQNSREGIYMIEGDHFYFANKRQLEITGFESLAELKKKNWVELVHPDDQERIRKMFNDFLAGKEAEKSDKYEFRMIREDKSSAYVETVVRRRKVFPNIVQTQGFVRDVTDRKIITELHENVHAIPKLFEKYLEGINAILPAKGSMIYFVNHSRQSTHFILRNCVPWDFANEFAVFPVKGQFVGHLRELNRGKILHLPLASFFEWFPNKTKRPYTGESVLVSPVRNNNGQLISISVSITSHKPNTSPDLRLLERINLQLELALDAAIQYRKTAISEKICESRPKVGQSYNEASQVLSDSILDVIQNTLHVEHASVYIFEEGESYRLVATTSDEKRPKNGIRFPRGKGSVGRIAEEGKIVAEYKQDKIAALFEYPKPWIEIPIERINSFIGVPLVDDRGLCVAVILGINKLAQNKKDIHVPFSHLDLEFFTSLQTFASLSLSVYNYAQQKEEETKVIRHETLAPASAIQSSILTLRSFLPDIDDKETATKMILQNLNAIYRLSESVQREADHILGMENIIDLLLDQKMLLYENPANISQDVVVYCMNQARSRLKRKFGPNAMKKVDIGESSDLERYMMDIKKMRQVFSNLFDNSIKYIPKGTKHDKLIRISYHSKSNGELQIFFSDYGNGIDEGIRERIFEKNFRGEDVKRFQRGMGYGLTICRRIVEAHKGRISVSNCRNPFTITITLSADRKERDRRKPYA